MDLKVKKEKDKQDQYVEIAQKIVLKNIDTDKYFVFLFGSRADKSCQFNSDVDIGIIGEKPLGKLYYKIIDELENSLIPYTIEIVDFSQVSEEFKKKVLKGKIIVWNQGKYLDQSFLLTNKQ